MSKIKSTDVVNIIKKQEKMHLYETLSLAGVISTFVFMMFVWIPVMDTEGSNVLLLNIFTLILFIGMFLLVRFWQKVTAEFRVLAHKHGVW